LSSEFIDFPYSLRPNLKSKIGTAVEFDFLTKLPNSNLDDRAFDDLVEECIQRIPRYCPEWTDHNLSDPGITFIEVFAWLTDQMLLRFNQVPRKNYVAFLELLGIRLQPPAPAQTDLTFYLSTDLPETYRIEAGVEVATLRTETTEAIVFSTDRPLIIGKPQLRHFLTAQTAEDSPNALRDRFTNQWTCSPTNVWEGREQALFADTPQPGNCFYLVLEPEDPIDGNVLAISFQGASATPTGINPNNPPRRWEAWDGEQWQSVLLQPTDDATRGFSFYEMAQQGGNPTQGTEVILHLPERFPVQTFTRYSGRWLRCFFTVPEANQSPFGSSPRITGLGVRSLGGTVRASQSSLVENERLGISDGKPGQTFEIQGTPILARRENEYIVVTPPGGLPQTWQEVSDFADSQPDDLHYTIDSLTGIVQFGPLIREPDQLRTKTRIRGKIQQPTPEDTQVQIRDTELQGLEYQYGGLPPRGAEIKMLAYRTGGGRQGNVQKDTLRFLKAAVPYIERVTNHQAATNGADAQSLEQAVLKAPQILRTRDRAITSEDFEVLAQKAGEGAIARVRCLSASSMSGAGTVRLILVPQANTDAIAQGDGISPDLFTLQPALRDRVLSYLDERRILGVQLQLQEAEFVGVSVQAEVALEPAYNNPLARQEILMNLRVALYRYLNPLTGGIDGKGWPFGRPVYTSDIIALLQKISGVYYLGTVLLFALRKQDGRWTRQPSPEPVIDPGSLGLICSWSDNRLRSSHVINII
jgi:predicted phage baseplate assembly protein